MVSETYNIPTTKKSSEIKNYFKLKAQDRWQLSDA